MANKKISELTAATTPLGGTELVEIVQGGENRKVSASDLGVTLSKALSSDINTGTDDAKYITSLGLKGSNYAVKKIQLACSDETTALTTGTAKITFRMPFAMTVTAVRASLTTAQASGSIFTVDINEGGTTILSTKLTIDNTEKTSTTAATPPIISDTSLADDAEITIDIDQVGDGTATGLKVTILGT